VQELPKTGDSVNSYVFLGGGLLVFGMFVLGLAWALGRRTANESAREG
jgi:LPXTG-motif cell wall-anchored protein